MLSLLDWFKKPHITSTIVFDERYCHSAGEHSGSHKYELRRGTTEIVFIFERFDEFIGTYLFNHPYLPDNIKQLVPQKKGVFCAQVVQNGAYLCTDSVNPNGHISFRLESLRPLHHRKHLRRFSNGAIAFGIFQPDTLHFHVLWATMYETNRAST
jgi:hypothetical protein